MGMRLTEWRVRVEIEAEISLPSSSWALLTEAHWRDVCDMPRQL
jgi:hypothetical protein